MNPSGNRHRSLHNELQKLFAKAKMPTSPALAARIVELIKDSKSSATDFGDVIRTDPALVTRLLKMANSVQFAQRNSVTAAGRAVAVLGIHRVKTISLGFQLVSHLDKLGGVPFDIKVFWQHSLLRACLARSFAQTLVPALEEEAFLVGLLQDCGILLLVQVLGESYARLYTSGLSPTAFHVAERKSFPHTHVDAITVMAATWNLPKVIATPLERHHQRMKPAGELSPTDQLGFISYLVGSLGFSSDAIVDPEEADHRDVATSALDLDDAKMAIVQARANEEYRGISTLYGDVLPEDVDVAELLGEANRQLATVAGDADQRLADATAQRANAEREQERLEESLRKYQERASIDPLTHVLNRGALTEATRKAITRNLDDGDPIGILFLDVDNFKRLNDTRGHEVGDNVLRSVAALLVREVASDGTVGRYGGEEFVVVVTGLAAVATRELAERIVKALRTEDMRTLGCPDPVTVSLGGIWSDRLPVNSAEALFSVADRLMYRAKHGGKDRCCFAPLRDPKVAGEERSDPTPSASKSSDAAEPASVRSTTDPKSEELFGIAEQLNATEADDFAGSRKQERKELVTGCTLHYFTGNGNKTRAAMAVIRNISTGGVGLLTRRPMARGEAVELVINKEPSKLYLAGLVTFCRRIKGTVHEVGVQFIVRSATPVFYKETSVALVRLSWVADARRAKCEGRLALHMRE